MKITAEDLRNAWNVNRGEMLPCNDLEVKGRRQKAEDRLRFAQDLPRWVRAIVRASNSNFCTGKVKADGHEPFIATFDWLVQPSTLTLIEEGHFDNRGAREIEPPAPGEIQRGVKFDTWRDEKGRLWAKRREFPRPA